MGQPNLWTTLTDRYLQCKRSLRFNLQARCRCQDVRVVDYAAYAKRAGGHTAQPRPGVFARYSAVDDACQRYVRFNRWIATSLVSYKQHKPHIPLPLLQGARTRLTANILKAPK